MRVPSPSMTATRSPTWACAASARWRPSAIASPCSAASEPAVTPTSSPPPCPPSRICGGDGVVGDAEARAERRGRQRDRRAHAGRRRARRPAPRPASRGPALVMASSPARPACRSWVTAWSMVVALNSSVQLMATVSTAACWPTRSAAWRCAGSRTPGSRRPATSRASGGPRSAGRRRAPRSVPRKPTATTRKSAVISDVAAAVSGARGGGRDGEQRHGAGEREQPADHAARARAAAARPRRRPARAVGGTRAARRPAAEHGEQRGQDSAADGRRDRQPAGADGEVRRGDAVAHEPVGRARGRASRPGQIPAAEPTRPTIAASQAIMRRIWPGVAATARRSAISRSRCWIDRPIVLATTKIAMNSASPPNDAVTAISVVRACLELGVLGLAARVAGEHLRAAGGGAQARGVEAGAGEHADRVDASRDGRPAAPPRRRSGRSPSAAATGWRGRATPTTVTVRAASVDARRSRAPSAAR